MSSKAEAASFRTVRPSSSAAARSRSAWAERTAPERFAPAGGDGTAKPAAIAISSSDAPSSAAIRAIVSNRGLRRSPPSSLAMWLGARPTRSASCDWVSFARSRAARRACDKVSLGPLTRSQSPALDRLTLCQFVLCYYIQYDTAPFGGMVL
jgi:hypothetical protein